MNTEGSPVDVKVAGLFSYPLKSGRVLTHTTASLLVSGLAHDREWMMVDTRFSPAQFVSQRECPSMARLSVALGADGALTLSMGDADELIIPATRGLNEAIAQRELKVKVWNHETLALDAGDAASRWLSAKFDRKPGELRLVRFNPEQRRDCSPVYSADSGAHTFFADGFPLLVASTASLADLNARIRSNGAGTLPMNRFRPNIVIDGLPAWDEDHVDTLTIGAVRIKLTKPCVRCLVTTTDQTTGERPSDEPLATLARFRNNVDFGGVTFGWNAVVLTPGPLSVGDTVQAEYRF